MTAPALVPWSAEHAAAFAEVERDVAVDLAARAVAGGPDPCIVVDVAGGRYEVSAASYYQRERSRTAPLAVLSLVAQLQAGEALAVVWSEAGVAVQELDVGATAREVCAGLDLDLDAVMRERRTLRDRRNP